MLAFSAGILVTGCDRPLSEPELHDPVYLDMQRGAKEWEKAEAEAAKKLQEMKTEYDSLDTKNAFRYRLKSDIQLQENLVLQIKQKSEHEKLLVKKRAKESAANYWKAREAKLPWPDPAEYEGFKAAQRLRASSRNWDDRVPKLKQSGMPNPPPPPPPQPPKN